MLKRNEEADNDEEQAPGKNGVVYKGQFLISMTTPKGAGFRRNSKILTPSLVAMVEML
jgi:hypothetical protein